MRVSSKLADIYVRATGLTAIYVIGPASGRPIKIGYAKRPRHRLETIKVGHWEKIIIHDAYWVANTAIAKAVEDATHAVLERQKLRLAGEWFDISASDGMAAIALVLESMGLQLMTDDYVWVEAKRAVDLIEAHLRKMQENRELKPVKRAYRAHRLKLASTQQKCESYGRWMTKWKRRLVEQAGMHIGAKLAGRRVQSIGDLIRQAIDQA
jgi:hypothetical protein